MLVGIESDFLEAGLELISRARRVAQARKEARQRG
jgi:hypothetical protein